MLYNHKKIEKKWQYFWKKHKRFKTTDKFHKKFYVLDMFPYPSAHGLHVGHLKGYTATDIIARFKRLKCFDVLHPIGWDAFGLPAEQFALQTGSYPGKIVKENIKNFKKQLESFGFSYDYDKEINTTDPKYYKHTQWIFSKFFENDLAAIKKIDVNWCKGLGTVLANEEIITNKKGEMVSERGGFKVEKKPMKQWVLKITAFAEKLYNNLSHLDWKISLKNLQKKWIRNSDGSLHLRDWIFSRQRYWGEPFPIMYDQDNQPILIKKLPVLLPVLKEIKPSGTGESPLANAKDWLYVKYKGKSYRRETNTMPQWAGSSWYYLAYILKNKDGSFDKLGSKRATKRLKKWLPVNIYIGGQEHAVLHLLYARFWHQFLYKLKLVPTPEPFEKVINQGMVLGPDGQKMSKSRGNVISPDGIVRKYGADTLRIYQMFMGPLEEKNSWNDKSLAGIYKWLGRVYRIYDDFVNKKGQIIKVISNYKNPEIIKKNNLFLKDVTKDINKFKFNTVVSKMMVLINDLYKCKKISKSKVIWKNFAIVLSLFAPHISEELLELLGEREIYYQKWPKPTFEVEIKDTVIAIQINGKTRAKVSVKKNMPEQSLITLAKNQNTIAKYLKNKTIIKVIFIENQVLNFVIQ